MSLRESVERVIPERFERIETTLVTLLEPVEERPSVGDALRSASRVCSLFVPLAFVVWATGYPYLFPSLGPSAYALAISPSAAPNQPQRVFGGHLFGVLGGLIAYHVFAPSVAITTLPSAFSTNALRLAGSAILSLGLTSAAMLTTDLRHAPACATTLIVALGFLSSLLDAGIILSAVVILIGLDYLLPGFGGVKSPPR